MGCVGGMSIMKWIFGKGGEERGELEGLGLKECRG